MKKGAQGATQTSNKSRLQLVFIFTRVHTKFGFNLKKGRTKINQERDYRLKCLVFVIVVGTVVDVKLSINDMN